MADDNPSTPEMVERGARAMYEVISDPKPAWDETHWSQRAFFRAYSEAHLQSMRVPTEAMIAAGLICALSDSHPGISDAEEIAKNVWHAMIDAAMGE